MSANTGSIETDLAHYEGLIWKTAKIIEPYVEEEFEDIQQIFRLKVARALEAFDPSRSRLSRDNYVFGCLTNQKTDLLRRRRHNHLHIEDLRETSRTMGSRDIEFASGNDRSSRFEGRYLSCEDPDPLELDDALVPSTITRLERQVLVRLYARVWVNFDADGKAAKDNRAAVLREVGEEFGLTRTQVASIMESIETKFADWRPNAAPVPEVLAA
jgi:RNA polymerase sigma factor (sigma-70 family)